MTDSVCSTYTLPRKKLKHRYNASLLMEDAANRDKKGGINKGGTRASATHDGRGRIQRAATSRRAVFRLAEQGRGGLFVQSNHVVLSSLM